MKPLYLVPEDDKDWSAFIRVGSGFVSSFNSNEGVIFTLEQVFGKGVVQPEEELIFSKDLWKASNMDLADYVTREGNVFRAMSSEEGILGFILPSGMVAKAPGTFTVDKRVITFPNLKISEAVFHQPDIKIGLAPESARRVAEILCWGSEVEQVALQRNNDEAAPHLLVPYPYSGEYYPRGFSAGLHGLICDIVPAVIEPLSVTGDGTGEPLNELLTENFSEYLEGSQLYIQTDEPELVRLIRALVNLLDNTDVNGSAQRLRDDLEMM